jgi:hypothetical protein
VPDVGVAVPLDRTDTRAAPVTVAIRWLQRPLVAAVVLLAFYAMLSLLANDRGFLGTDTGGKVATVKLMSERGDFDPDLGYWAAAWDPDAAVHGLFYTSRYGERFVNVTTLPMVLAARPLWDLGGYRVSLLLPMLGSVAAAFAARRLAVLLGGASVAWPTFWLVGLASPAVVYALDLWEHSLGLGAMAWGAVFLFGAAWDRFRWWSGLAAGALFGVAAAMRTEAFVFVLTTTAVACCAIAFGARRSLMRSIVTGAGAVGGFVAAFGANLLLERAVLGEATRSDRASGAAASGLGSLTGRAREGLTTILSPFPTGGEEGWILGALLLGGIMVAAVAATRPALHRRAVMAAAIVVVVVVLRLADGPGFVPGLLAAAPVAGVGLALGWSETRSRQVVLAALLPLPLVIAFQFMGGAVPQWGGRYLLLSGFLLTVVGVVEGRRMAQWARIGSIGLAVVISVLGVAWLVQRSHGIADAAARIECRPEAVLISPNGFVPREFGASYPERRWLATRGRGDLPLAVDVVEASGADDFAVVDVDTSGDLPEFPGWRYVDSEIVPFLSGVDFRVSTYERRP